MDLKKKFTPNDVIEEFEMNDKIIDLTGYVDNIEAKHLATNNAYISKMMINNNNGKRIQIVAWGKFIEKMEIVADLQNVVRIEGACSKFVSRNARFNSGNVDFQSEVKEHTLLKKLGQYTPLAVIPIAKVFQFDNISSAVDRIKIEGTIKNNFRILKTKFQKYGLDSICNGVFKLEVRIPEFKGDELLHIHKGHQIMIEGDLNRKNKYLNVSDTGPY